MMGVEQFTDFFNFVQTSLILGDDPIPTIVPKWLDNLEQVPVHREVHKVIIIQRPAFRKLTDCHRRDGPQKPYHATPTNQQITDLKPGKVFFFIMRWICVHLTDKF